MQTDRRHERPRRSGSLPSRRSPGSTCVRSRSWRCVRRLDVLDRQRHAGEHRAAAAAADAPGRCATRDAQPVRRGGPRLLRLYFVYPNLGLAGPFFDGDVQPLKEMAWLGPRRHPAWAGRAGRVPRPPVGPHLRRGPQGPGGRALRAGPLAALGPAVGRPADRRTPPPAHRRPDDRRRVRAPALLAWAIERHPRRLDELSTADVRHKHGLLEQRHMAAFLGMKPNTLAQSLKRFRARLGRRCALSGTSSARLTTTRTRNDERPRPHRRRPGRSPRRT